MWQLCGYFEAECEIGVGMKFKLRPQPVKPVISSGNNSIYIDASPIYCHAKVSLIKKVEDTLVLTIGKGLGTNSA